MQSLRIWWGAHHADKVHLSSDCQMRLHGSPVSAPATMTILFFEGKVVHSCDVDLACGDPDAKLYLWALMLLYSVQYLRDELQQHHDAQLDALPTASCSCAYAADESTTRFQLLPTYPIAEHFALSFDRKAGVREPCVACTASRPGGVLWDEDK